MSHLEKIFAEKLLNVKAIKLQPEQPFTWASGWKSPFYCDNRKTLSFPSLRNFVKIELARIIAEQFPEADAVAGVATGAEPAFLPSSPASIFRFLNNLAAASIFLICARKILHFLLP